MSFFNVIVHANKLTNIHREQKRNRDADSLQRLVISYFWQYSKAPQNLCKLFVESERYKYVASHWLDTWEYAFLDQRQRGFKSGLESPEILNSRCRSNAISAKLLHGEQKSHIWFRPNRRQFGALLLFLKSSVRTNKRILDSRNPIPRERGCVILCGLEIRWARKYSQCNTDTQTTKTPQFCECRYIVWVKKSKPQIFYPYLCQIVWQYNI